MKRMAKGNNNATNGKLNVLVEGTSIVGDITSDSNFRIDGKLKGSLKINGKLVLGLAGAIEGTISCDSAEVEGSFNGEIKVQNVLSLKSSAKIVGDIFTKQISIEPGAQFTGNCTMGSSPKAE